jgi:hypothetical protein
MEPFDSWNTKRQQASDSNFQTFEHNGAEYERVGQSKVYRRSPSKTKRRTDGQRQATLGSFEAARRGAVEKGRPHFQYNGKYYDRLGQTGIYHKSPVRKPKQPRNASPLLVDSLHPPHQPQQQLRHPHRDNQLRQHEKVAAIRQRLSPLQPSVTHHQSSDDSYDSDFYDSDDSYDSSESSASDRSHTDVYQQADRKDELAQIVRLREKARQERADRG